MGFVVQNIRKFEKNMIFQKKIKEVFDEYQQATLALYSNYSNAYIELIEPLDEKSFTWNALIKNGNHFHHLCYSVRTAEEMNCIAKEERLIEIMKPVPAILFNNQYVAFYFSRNKQIIEFVIDI